MILKRQPLPIEGNVRYIRVGTKHLMYVDADDYERLSKHTWHAKKDKNQVYAVRRFIVDGKTVEIRAHREIMQSPEGFEPHHKNHCGLDNRKCNLENVPHDNHPHMEYA